MRFDALKVIPAVVALLIGNSAFKAHAQMDQIPEHIQRQMKGVDERTLSLPPVPLDETILPTLLGFATSDPDTGNVGFVLLALLGNLFLLTPGILFFYCGIFRRADCIQQFQRCLPLVVILSLGWALWIYTLGFSRNLGSQDVVPGEIDALKTDVYDGNQFIGSFNHAFMRGLDSQIGTYRPRFPLRRRTDTIPHLLFMTFQMTLFVATPIPMVLLLSERFRLTQLILFLLLWGTLVYAPVAYWTWGGGWLTKTLDGGGGNVIHVTVGITALVLSFLFSKREAELDRPTTWVHDLYLILGTAMYWGGSILSNSARTFAADGIAVNAGVATYLAACTGFLGWVGADWLVRGKSDVQGCCAGIISGLIAISAAVRYVAPQSALIIGLLGGVLNFTFYSFLQRRVFQRDVLTVSALHAVAGILSVMMTGVLATASCGGFDLHGNPVAGLIGGNPSQLVHQVKAVGATVLISIIGTAIAATIVRLAIRGPNPVTPPETSTVHAT